MSFSIQTNVNSLAAQENLRVNGEFQSRTIQRLTSGYRINSSGDDAAGLAVANKFRADVTELQQGVRNANDGISQLQIIDGGLSNISQMLDRMKTLATQSSSATFTGNRVTLNTEYGQLLKEIDRQATNIGLNNGGGYNKNLGVYIGGATGSVAQSNSQVNIDLSGTGNQVDAAGLGVSGTNVSGAGIDMGAITATVTDATGLSISVSVLDASKTDGSSKTVTLTSLAAGYTAQQAVDNLNTQVASDQSLSAAGITFAVQNGKLMVGGNKAFYANASNGAAGRLLAASKATENTAMYNKTYAAVATATGAQTLTFTNLKTGAQKTVAFSNESVTAQVQAINNAANSIGIYAVLDTAAVSLQSADSFTWQSSSTAGAGLGAKAGAAATNETMVAADATLDPTSVAQQAIRQISAAVSALGSVQGRVGAGQNKLNYAINLAQSQVTNFSAAESRIRDADVAAEAANLTKAQVLQQASLAAMAQANSAPQAVMALLRG